MQVQMEQVHWSGLKGSEMSMAVMGELSVVLVLVSGLVEREGGGGNWGAAVDALRFGVAWLRSRSRSASCKRGETGLGAVVEEARALIVLEREELCMGLMGETMLGGRAEDAAEACDRLVVERGDLEEA